MAAITCFSPCPKGPAQLFEVFFHLLSGTLDQSGVIQDVLDLCWGGVAADVLLLHYLLQVSSVTKPVDDVLKDLLLTLRRVGAEERIPEGSLFLGSFAARLTS